VLEPESTQESELTPILEEAESSTPISTSNERPRYRIGQESRPPALFAMVLTGLLFVAGGFALIASKQASSKNVAPQSPRSIAVLPLASFSDDPADAFFADGLTESLIKSLSGIKGLKVVIARSSAFKGKDVDPQQVGRQLGVSRVLEGGVRKFRDRIRVTLRMISVEDGQVLWAGDSYDRSMDDLFTVQDEITRNMVSALQGQLGVSDSTPDNRTTRDLEAYTLYMKGRFFWNKRTEDGLRKSIEYFERARARDENYALAYAGLADAYVHLNLYSPAPNSDSFLKAKQAAEKALVIDESLAEAHTTLGYIKEQYEWDWTGAEAEFKRALQLNPNYATAHQYYAEYLALVNRIPESIAHIERAHELDPYSLIIVTERSYPLQWARKWDEALKQIDKALEMEPNFTLAVFYAARCHLQKGDFDKAISLSRKAVELSGGSPLTVAGLGYAYAAAGKQAQAREVLRKLTKEAQKGSVPPYLIATIHIGLGEDDEALRWLEKAYEKHDWLLVILKMDPRFDRVRADERFESLLSRVGLVT
jgi:TolB-like protein/Tfp pilus assembly protein PilF